MTPSYRTEILPTHTVGLFQVAVEQAARRLRAGDVVALPTETVYGLAANALDADAVARIFAVKGRPAHNPIIVHVDGLELARRCVASWPAVAERLAMAFWPGPLTLVLPKAPEVPAIVTAGGPTVGVRWPRHLFIQAVMRACGFPLAAPSANPSNRLSPTSAEHVLHHLAGKIPLIVDGGLCSVGIESTVVDLVEEPPRMLRPGMISAESLLAVIGRLAAGETVTSDRKRSPGLLPKHYSPQARLVVLRWADDAELLSQLAVLKARAAATHLIVHTQIPKGIAWGRVCVLPHAAEAYARALYTELHRGDEAGAELIVVESVPDTPAWKGLADRLHRASTP